MTKLPIALSRDESENLIIEWDDRTITKLSPKRLRDACPCANCQEKKKGAAQSQPKSLPILKFEETQPLKILEMRPIGNYAYGIKFSDGHSSGLFTMELLSQLG